MSRWRKEKENAMMITGQKKWCTNKVIRVAFISTIKRTHQIAHKIKLEILSISAKLLLWLQVKKKKDQTDCSF